MGILGPSANSQLPGHVGHGLDRLIDLVLGVLRREGEANAATLQGRDGKDRRSDQPGQDLLAPCLTPLFG